MIEQVILDIKGVLYDESRYVDVKVKKVREGAIDLIDYLRQVSLPFVLGTNVTTEMTDDLLKELDELGFDIPREDVVSCVDLSVPYLKEQGLRRIFLVSDNERLREFYSQQGFEIVDYGSDAVVVGLDRDLQPDTLQVAVNELFGGSMLVGLHRNMTRVNSKGERSYNVGQIVADLEKAACLEPSQTVIIGKPSQTFYIEAIKRLPSQKPAVTLMVGDDPVGDLSGAYLLGMPTAFVRSEKYSSWPAKMDFKPDYNVEHLGELVGTL
jgi:HAD superfamily hydrolase (TIGR01450 family)